MHPTPIPPGRSMELPDTDASREADPPDSPDKLEAPDESEASDDSGTHEASTGRSRAGQSRAGRSRAGRALTAAAGAGLLTVTVLVGWGLHARAEAAGTNRATSSVRSQVHRTLDRLRATEGQRSAIAVHLRTAGTTLSFETALLRAEQSDLSRDQSAISAQGVNISELETCLTGVQETLNEISLDDDTDALSSLEAVIPACNAAGPAG